MPTGDYRTADGMSVPGVTTIIGQLSKPALIYWAHKLGRQGLSLDDERDRAMGVGTEVHALIEADISDDIPQERFRELRASASEPVVAAYERWGKWYEGLREKPIDVERQLVSERLRVGGCPDLVVRDENGLCWIVDWKTQHSLKTKPYESHRIQLAAYGMLYAEVTGEPVGGGIVVLLSSNPRARNHVREFRMHYHELEHERRAFELLVSLYGHLNQIKRRVA